LTARKVTCNECSTEYAAEARMICDECLVEGEPVAGLRSGFTPLVRAQRLADELG